MAGRPRQSVDTTNWTRENLAWLAGLYEGQGNLHYTTNWMLTVIGSEGDVIEKVQRIAGFGSVRGPYYAPGAKEHYRPMYRWRTSSHAVGALLVAMWPWLGQRRRSDAIPAIRGERP